MLDNIRQINVLSKIFNVNGREWERVFVAWTLHFLYKVGFVLGWTVLVAMFVSTYGIVALPYLFILNACFKVVGSVLYSSFLHRFGKEEVMVASIFAGGALLFFAMHALPKSQVLFFALTIVSISVFLHQFSITLIGYIEDMFTPLESERTFPLIEASQTMGGIVAGLVITFLSSGFNPASFVYIWIGFLFLIVPFILFNKFAPPDKKKDLQVIGVFTKTKKALSNAKIRSYVKGLFFIVFFQWLLYNLLEFQYTKAVYQNVSSVVIDAGSGFEHALFHDLGTLFLIFSASALVIQLFVGSRLITHLGIVGTMLLHPLVTLLGLFGLTGYFNFWTAVFAKNNFTMTTAVHTNAYHSAYYAVNEDMRFYVRELLEGMVRPIGAIIGTLAIIAMQLFLNDSELVFYINLLMVLVAASMFLVTYRQQKLYTRVAIRDLRSSKDEEDRFTAIEILAQRGHDGSVKEFRKVLADDSEPLPIKVAVIKAMAALRSQNSVVDMLNYLSSPKTEIRRAALDALLSFKLSDQESIFLKYNLINTLKDLYKSERDHENLGRIVSLMSRISNVEAVEFLVSVLKSPKSKHKVEAINALGSYNDPAVLSFLRPFLTSQKNDERINAAIAVASFTDYFREGFKIVQNFLASKEKSKLALGLYAVGEMKLKDKRHLCHRHLKSTNINVALQAAVALAKMNSHDGLALIVNSLLNGSDARKRQLNFLLSKVDVRISKNIDKMLRQAKSKK